MKKLLFGAIVLASILSSDGMGAAQTGVPCYYDWSTAPRQHFMIADSPEYKSIVAACRQQRAETVPWDQHIQMFQQAVDMRALSGGPQANLVQLVEMLRKERDHLRAASATRPPATRSVPSPGDSNVRYFDLGPMLTQRVAQPDRLVVAPEFRSWVPQFLRERVGNIFRVHGRITHFEGEATIRRGDEMVRVSKLLQRGNTWVLRPGDIFDVQQGRLVLEYDGKRYEVRGRGTIGIDLDEQCMTRTRHGGGGRQRLPGTPVYLIEGTLLYTTTTTAVRQACVVTTPDVTVSIRGTSFTASHTPSERGGTLSVTVHAGEIALEKRTGETELLRAGQSHWGTYSNPASAPATTTLRYEWEVQNNCSRDLDFKLFELNLRDEVTGSWQAVSIAAGERKRIPIRPTPGGKVCYGAATRQGNLEWGLGLDGSGTCDRCCSETLEATAGTLRTANLTCPGK